MRNKITDLNEYLFNQLDELSNDDLSDEELEKAIDKSKAITSVAKTIIDNGKLMLDAQKHADEYYRNPNKKVIEMLGIEYEE